MREWPETCESLILRVKNAQDTRAWDQFVATYRPIVLRLAQQRGLQSADADDVAQRILFSVSTAVENWEPASNGPRFRNWLGRIARNAIINALTRQKPDRGSGSSSIQGLLEEVPANNVLADALKMEGRVEAVRWAARCVEPEFTPATWAMFYETTVLGNSVADVAQLQKRSVGAVYVARCRVMQRIRTKITEVSDIWSIDT